MATNTKQYKNIGEELWKGRPEKIVGSRPGHTHIAEPARMQSCLR